MTKGTSGEAFAPFSPEMMALAEAVQYGPTDRGIGPSLRRTLTASELAALPRLPQIIEAASEALKPASEETRNAMLLRLALHFPLQKMSEKQWKTWAQGYHQVLAKFGPHVLEEFEVKWLAGQCGDGTGVRFPKPAEAFNHCERAHAAKAMRVQLLADLPRAVAEDEERRRHRK